MRKVSRNANVAWRNLNDQGVLLDVDSGKVLGLNGTAARIWELIGDETAVDEIARQVVEEFSVSEEDARADIDEFLAALDSRGLVCVRER